MTCIIGLEHDGHVYIGADSAQSSENMIEPSAISKIWRHGPFLFAGTGTWRVLQLLRYQMDGIEIQTCDDDIEYMVKRLVAPIRELVKEHGSSRISENEEAMSGWSSLIVGYKQRCYQISPRFAVLQSAHGYYCDGTGAEYAYGAMAALADLPPKKRIRRSLEIAAQFNPFVAGPFAIERL